MYYKIADYIEERSSDYPLEDLVSHLCLLYLGDVFVVVVKIRLVSQWVKEVFVLNLANDTFFISRSGVMVHSEHDLLLVVIELIDEGLDVGKEGS